MKTFEYEETTIPDEVHTRAEKLTLLDQSDPANLPTMKNTGFIDWLNERGRDGWRVEWSQFRHPFVVFEREVVTEEVEK